MQENKFVTPSLKAILYLYFILLSHFLLMILVVLIFFYLFYFIDKAGRFDIMITIFTFIRMFLVSLFIVLLIYLWDAILIYRKVFFLTYSLREEGILIEYPSIKREAPISYQEIQKIDVFQDGLAKICGLKTVGIKVINRDAFQKEIPWIVALASFSSIVVFSGVMQHWKRYEVVLYINTKEIEFWLNKEAIKPKLTHRKAKWFSFLISD